MELKDASGSGVLCLPGLPMNGLEAPMGGRSENPSTKGVPVRNFTPSWTVREVLVSVALYPDHEAGGFTAVSVSIPGVIAEGETESEAIDAAREGILELIALCEAEGQDVPGPKPLHELIDAEDLGRAVEKHIVVRIG